MNDSGPDTSPLQFPCRFPIKAFGAATPGFAEHVAAIVRRHVGELPTDAIRTRPSAQRNYIAVTVTIEARSRDQLDAIYRDLSASDQVAMAL